MTPHPLLRSRDAHARVTYVELFFDLVFVFAVTQLSHTLVEHLTLIGALQTLFLLLAVWWVWMYTCWFTNWVDPDRPPVRALIFALMLAGLLLSASLPHAFDGEALLFASAYVFSQVVRSAFMLWATHGHDHLNFNNFRRIISWQLVSGVFWIAGGFSARGDASHPVGDRAGHRMRRAVRGLPRAGARAFRHRRLAGGRRAHGRAQRAVRDHRARRIHPRHRRDGRRAAGHRRPCRAPSWSRSSAASRCGGSTSTSAPNAAATRSRTRTDPGRVARAVYTYFHIPIVAGIVVCAVADEITIKHPVGHMELSAAATLLGGPALYLAGNILFKRASARHYPLSHLVGLGLLLLLAPVAMRLTPLALGAATTVVLVLVAVWETRSFASECVGRRSASH